MFSWLVLVILIYSFEQHLMPWLLKQETQLSLTNCATHLWKCVADLLKHAPPYMCYHAEFGRSASTNTGEFPKLGSAGTVLGWEAWLTSRYTPLPDMCYHVRFGSPATKGVCINRREPQNWGVLGPRPLRWAWLTPRNTPLAHILSNLAVLGQMVRVLLRRSLLPAFQGHSRSSELTRIDPVTSY